MDGSKHQKGRDKGSLPSKDTQGYIHDTIPLSHSYANNMKQRRRDGVMYNYIIVYNYFLGNDPLSLPFWCIEPSLYPPSFGRNDFSTIGIGGA